jgi:hypothetical protein
LGSAKIDAELEDALACAHRLAAGKLASSIEFFGESVSDPDEADRVADRYVELAPRSIGRPSTPSCRSISPTSGSTSPGDTDSRRRRESRASQPD